MSIYPGGNNGRLKGYILHPPAVKQIEIILLRGYANFRPNVFAAGKRISIEILEAVGLHARCPVALTRFVAFLKNGNVQEKYLSSL